MGENITPTTHIRTEAFVKPSKYAVQLQGERTAAEEASFKFFDGQRRASALPQRNNRSRLKGSAHKLLAGAGCNSATELLMAFTTPGVTSLEPRTIHQLQGFPGSGSCRRYRTPPETSER